MRKLLIKIGSGLIMIGIPTLLWYSCTENTRAKKLGGDMTVDLPAGQKLITATWKDDGSLWYLTTPMTSTDSPKVSTFKEKSSFGVLEGRVFLKEHK